MIFSDLLNGAVEANNSLLCVGLDTDPAKLPSSIKSQQPILDFNKSIIDATADLVCAFKLNSAFYEASGDQGLQQLRDSVAYIKEHYPKLPVILDAKRADIGNTNDGYVSFCFDYLKVDGVTLHPYLGQEALEPFLSRKDKGIIILCRTSNPGAGEFQDLEVDGHQPLYERVAENVATKWNQNHNCLLVVGATYPKEMQVIRSIVGPEMPFLVPGIGAQGGNVEATLTAGGENLIINSSRAVIYAGSSPDFADAARKVAQATQEEINKYRRQDTV